MKIKTSPLGNMGANFYMVTCEETNELFVVDPGACADIAIDLIKDSGAQLKYIILTHAHADHIGALDSVKAVYDVPVVICSEENDALNNDTYNLCSMFGMHSPKTTADICVSDGDTLPFGNGEIRFLHTPGHTKGSMCIHFENCLISGDTLFYGSIGRTDFPGGSFKEIEKSIVEKIYSLDSNTMIYPGHGNPTSVKFEMKNNPFVHR